jgi:hypothetical protein
LASSACGVRSGARGVGCQPPTGAECPPCAAVSARGGRSVSAVRGGLGVGVDAQGVCWFEGYRGSRSWAGVGTGAEQQQRRARLGEHESRLAAWPTRDSGPPIAASRALGRTQSPPPSPNAIGHASDRPPSSLPPIPLACSCSPSPNKFLGPALATGLFIFCLVQGARRPRSPRSPQRPTRARAPDCTSRPISLQSRAASRPSAQPASRTSGSLRFASPSLASRQRRRHRRLRHTACSGARSGILPAPPCRRRTYAITRHLCNLTACTRPPSRTPLVRGVILLNGTLRVFLYSSPGQRCVLFHGDLRSAHLSFRGSTLLHNSSLSCVRSLQIIKH